MFAVLPVVLIFGFSWAAVTVLRVAASLLGAYRGATRRLEPEAVTSLVFGPPGIMNLWVAAAVTIIAATWFS